MTRHTTAERPFWSGIHYLLYLRQPDDEQDCARFSLFQTEYSPVGGGHAAFFYVDPAHPSAVANGVYTDNPELAVWLYDRMYRNRDNPLACLLPAQSAADARGASSKTEASIITARFGRRGDLHRSLSYHIDTANVQITGTWAGLEPPFVHHGAGGVSSVYTYCFFITATSASLTVGEETVPGAIYQRQDWAPLVGRPLSSCLIGDEFWAQR